MLGWAAIVAVVILYWAILRIRPKTKARELTVTVMCSRITIRDEEDQVLLTFDEEEAQEV